MKRLLILSLFISMLLFGCGGGGGDSAPPASVPPTTYDATGDWDFETTGNWASPGCTKGEDKSGTFYLSQSGNTWSAVVDGDKFTGTIKGSVYTGTASYPQGGGTMTEVATLTLSSSTEGFGEIIWCWKSEYDECGGGMNVFIDKVVDDPEDPEDPAGPVPIILPGTQHYPSGGIDASDIAGDYLLEYFRVWTAPGYDYPWPGLTQGDFDHFYGEMRICPDGTIQQFFWIQDRYGWADGEILEIVSDDHTAWKQKMRVSSLGHVYWIDISVRCKTSPSYPYIYDVTVETLVLPYTSGSPSEEWGETDFWASTNDDLQYIDLSCDYLGQSIQRDVWEKTVEAAPGSVAKELVGPLP